MLVKYSAGCVADITNLGPNSKCVTFRIGYAMSEYMECHEFDLNNCNWFMFARTIDDDEVSVHGTTFQINPSNELHKWVKVKVVK